jgi:deubiquitinase DESI2
MLYAPCRYDVTNAPNDSLNKAVKALNAVTRGIGFGVFHGGLEVLGQEWSFGYCPAGTGVYCCRPKSNPLYEYRESVDLGSTALRPEEIADLVRKFKAAWQGSSYELLTRNCCHFVDELARELGCQPIPGWLNRFAEASDATVTFFSSLYNNMRAIGTEIAAEMQRGNERLLQAGAASGPGDREGTSAGTGPASGDGSGNGGAALNPLKKLGQSGIFQAIKSASSDRLDRLAARAGGGGGGTAGGSRSRSPPPVAPLGAGASGKAEGEGVVAAAEGNAAPNGEGAAAER